MSAIATLSLNDGQATPVLKTFSPNGTKEGIASWSDRSGGIALGYPTITHSLKTPTKGSRAYKMTAKVVLPILEQTSASTATGIQPAPTLAYNLLANIEFVLPERCTSAQRKDLLAFVKNFLATTGVVTPAVVDFEPVY